MAISIEACPHIISFAALGTESGNQKNLTRHQLAQSSGVFGFGCADHCTKQAETTLPDVSRLISKPGDQCRDSISDTATIGELQRLYRITAGITGAHEGKETFLMSASSINERLNAVITQVCVDRQRVGRSRFIQIGKRRIGEAARGIMLRADADVPAFRISDDEQTKVGGFVDERMVKLDSRPEITLKTGGLEFDAGRMRSDGMENAGTILVNGGKSDARMR